MLILGLDTSTSLVSIGLIREDEILGEITLEGSRRQLAKLISWIDFLLKESDANITQLNGLACISGPGSFSGLRIGLATIQGIALALGIPIVELYSLDVLAQITTYPEVCILVHSQADNFFHAHYRNGKREGNIAVDSATKIIETIPVSLLVTPHRAQLEKSLRDCHQKCVTVIPVMVSGVRVAEIAQESFKLGKVIDPLELTPKYLRSSSAEEKKYAAKSLS